MRWQLGQFFVVVGFLGLIIFMITNWANNPTYTYFCSGSLVLLLGVYLMWTGRKPPEAADRFRSYRSLKRRREERRQASEERASAKEKE